MSSFQVREDAPVLIVGAGPVGMTAALLLAGFGVRSLMLEAKHERDAAGSRALCMQRDVLDILHRVGDVTPLVRRGATWSLGRTYFRGHELFQITFPDAGRAHFPPFVNIGQDQTERWLESLVDRSDLTEVRYGHEVVGISAHDDGAEVRVATAGGEHRLRGRYLIAADGSHAFSREALGVGFPGVSFDDQFLICDVRARLPFANERRFFFDPEWNPGRQVLIHPQADSVWRIDWQVPPDFDLAAERASGALDARIRRITGDARYEVVWLTVYRFHQRIADRVAVGRAFLAGDAAHLTPGPVSTFDLDTLDPAGILRSATGAERELAVVVRPDGHIAAIVDSASLTLAACSRAIGLTRSNGVTRSGH